MNVLFVQPVLPHYRVAFFRELNRHVCVRVWSDHHSATLPHTDPAGAFEVAHHPERWLSGGLLSQPAHLKAVRSAWPDVVVLPWNTRYVQLIPALAEARLRGRPVVLWGHGFSKREHPVRRVVRNAVGQLGHACVTYSPRTSRQLVEHGLHANSVFAAPNSIDGAPMQRLREQWLANPQGLQQVAQRHGLNPDKLVLFVSRLEPDKRVPLLLEAFAYVRTQVPDAQLAIVGGGSQWQAVQNYVQELGLLEAVRLLGPLYNETELAALFTCSKLFAYPVAIGLSLLHAFNYGLPVVTSDDQSAHNPEFENLIHEVNGLVYADGQSEAFGASIVRLLQDDTLRRRLASAALASVSPPDGRTLEGMVDGMLGALNYAASRIGW